MKPDWSEAPEWARWLAQDPDGEWYWYQNKPYMLATAEWVVSGRIARAGQSDYEQEPEPRP